MNVASLSKRGVALVTGASGFTGRYVAERLALAGYTVRRWTGAGGDGDASVDLLDRGRVRDRVAEMSPDVVVHLAAISFVAHGDVDEIYRVNVVGTRHLLEALADNQVRPSRVVLASSANIYGNVSGRIAELAPASPQNDYAVSKLAMEHMASLWQDALPIVITRPFNYTGVGQSAKFLLPKIVGHFKRRAPTMELGNLDVSRDFYDVRGVAETILRLIESEAVGIFNICSGEEHSLADIVEMMKRISGHSLEVKVNPAFVRTNEIKSLCGDNKKLVEQIGGLPEYPIKETLRWMYEESNSVVVSNA